MAFLTLRHYWRAIFSPKRRRPRPVRHRTSLSLSRSHRVPFLASPGHFASLLPLIRVRARYIKDSTRIAVVDDDGSLSLPHRLTVALGDSKFSDAVKWAFNAFNSAALPSLRHPPLLSTRKNVSRCAWRFIKFELRRGIEFRWRSPSNELEKPSRTAAAEATEVDEKRRGKSKKEAAERNGWKPRSSERYPANCFWPSRDIRLRPANNRWLRLRTLTLIFFSFAFSLFPISISISLLFSLFFFF